MPSKHAQMAIQDFQRGAELYLKIAGMKERDKREKEAAELAKTLADVQLLNAKRDEINDNIKKSNLELEGKIKALELSAAQMKYGAEATKRREEMAQGLGQNWQGQPGMLPYAQELTRAGDISGAAGLMKPTPDKLPASEIGLFMSGMQGNQQHMNWYEELQKRKAAQKTTSTPSYDKNLFIAAQAAGIGVDKVKNGTLTEKDAIKVADEYRKLFGTESLFQMLLQGAGNAPPSKYSFDSEGNLIE